MSATAHTAGSQSRAQTHSRAERLRSALERNVFVVSALGACCAAHVILIRAALGSDAWYTLVGGRTIAKHGLPHHDALTWLTLGHVWVDQQWLAQLGLYGLWAAGSWPLALAALVLLFLAAYVVAAAGARGRGASDRSTAIVVLAAFVAGLPNTAFRAQVASYVLFSIVLALLLRDDRRTSRTVYLVFPVLIVWANVHGSVVAGAALVSLLGVVEIVRSVRARARVGGWAPRSAALVVLPWLCTLSSPYGLALPRYYRSILDNHALASSVTEWGPSSIRGQPVFFVLLIAALWLAARSRGALTPFSQLVLLGTGVAGLAAVRNEVWFALAVAAIVPAALDALWRPSPAPRRASVNALLAAAGLVVATVALLSLAGHPRSWFERAYPPKAVAALARAASAEPAAKVFADERYADWLLLEDPSLAGRVAYDDRFELLSTRQLDRIVAFREEHGYDWQRAANGYRLLVLSPGGDRGAVELYEKQSGTQVLYRDSNVVVLERRA
jgi:hypothetical protein